MSMRSLVSGIVVGICFSLMIGLFTIPSAQWQGMPIAIPHKSGHEIPSPLLPSLDKFNRDGIAFIKDLQQLKRKNPNKTIEVDQSIANANLLFSSIQKSVELFSGLNATNPNMTGLIEIFQNMIVGMKYNSNKIADLKKMEASRNHTSGSGAIGFVDKVLQDISDSADNLESSMTGQAFEKGVNETSEVKTVISINKKSETGINVLHLVDSDENEYTLTKAADITAHYNDTQLFNEFLLILLMALMGSYGLRTLGLPAFLGHLFIGGMLGSYSLIGSIIPIDTVARGFGTLFIMFSLGLEFNLDKIKKVWLVSVVTASLVFVILIISCLIGGYFLNAEFKESILVGCCISLSSTLVAFSLVKDHEMDLPYVRYMLGILVIQDVFLGFILGMIPVLSSSLSDAPFAALRIIGSLIIFVIISLIFYMLVIRILLNVTPKNSHESYLSLSLGYCILLLLLAEYLDISGEFACFIAGVVIASNEVQRERTLKLIEPLKIVFSSLFFASIGLFIYPSFLMQHLVVLGISTIVLVSIKVIIGYIILQCFKIKNLKSLKIAIGLSQISEFSLIISSRAKNANLIGREAYYALLGVIILSLLTTPVLWYIVSMMDSLTSPVYDEEYHSVENKES